MNVLIGERPASVPLLAAGRALGLNRSSVYARRRREAGGVELRRSRQG
ncbi:MAG: hypothetical protein GKR94_27745 [Gammaproteobacteria bacterium]|nr:hypothetical protein [Gammaproteobacteria bacterium]